MERRILHADFNGFYASVECLLHPELRESPVAVAGDPESRHGIILAKNEYAKKFKIKTGEAIWQARQKCPNLVVVKPTFGEYLKFSKLGRQIYSEYSDRVEAFGLDENWIDLTASTDDFEEAERIAEEIRFRIKDELGITVSIGLANNKIFAKLGSDMKKPDALTVITPDNYRDLVWNLPASDLLYVGRSTGAKLFQRGIVTIGDIAQTDPKLLKSWLGKGGLMLHSFANGLDSSEVMHTVDSNPIKSVGNGVTAPRDLVDNDDVRLTFMMLCESVSARLRNSGFRARTVQICVRDCELYWFVRQKKLDNPSFLTDELLKGAMELFMANYDWYRPIRSLTIAGCDLIPLDAPEQLTLFNDAQMRERRERAEYTIDGIRGRFGYNSVLRALMLTDKRIGLMNPKEEHIIFPVGYRA